MAQVIKSVQNCFKILILLYASVVMFSCADKSEELIFEEGVVTPLFKGYPNYLVTTVSYTRIYGQKDSMGSVVGVARKGEVFNIISPEGSDSHGFLWYKVLYKGKTGWILALDPELVFLYDRAKFVSKQMRD